MNKKQRIQDLESQIAHFKKQSTTHQDKIKTLHSQITNETAEFDSMVLYMRALERHVRFLEGVSE